MRRPTRSIRGCRASVSIVILTAFFAAGCGTVGRTVGAGLAGAGVVATGTGVVLAVGCSSPDPTNPALERSGQPCLPAQTYETYKPAILTGIVLGLILIGAGVAVYSVSSPPPATNAPPPRPPPPPEPEESTPEQACKAYCF
ncbi:hypothetical protein [Polyangium sp. y55x31]|uniref:hypothetical protein n=1 Tax=Polyangium sp. y55x31 TaxID=3042688 RepID=UPI002482CE32|nr:hypothetical protein [Polyangium sp. y55x31]MDI1484460.1 hypothetical protein [Polyangium sp. y55x31]